MPRSIADQLATRLAKAKWAFTTRRVNRAAAQTLITDPGTIPAAGDLVLARIDVIGQHTTVELPTGRKAAIRPGDEILVSYGNRYAPDQFEALVPVDLGPAHLVAGGGIAARSVAQHVRMKEATTIIPIGLLADAQGKPLNLKSFALPGSHQPAPPIIGVFGTSMNAGKTTTAASIIRGLTNAGYRVGAAKVTGTGAGNDLWSMYDAGAVASYDFTDAGFATTYLAPVEDIIRGAVTLSSALAAGGAEVVVMEIADGLFQEETAALAAHGDFRAMLTASVFAAGDSMGAVAGASRLRELGHSVVAISGLVTCSPLGMRETRSSGLPVFTAAELCDGAVAAQAFGQVICPELPTLALAG
ncbi:MAG: hypothetical protein WA988_19480 [Candidatus Nanopelagicales bacterium]